MKCIMRLDKSQVASARRWDAAGSASTFNSDVAVMAGYKTYDAIIVGGAGGKSGAARTRVLFGGDRAWNYGCGGGGGASLRLQGNLVDLPTVVAVTVGAAGANGANGGDDAKAGNGIDGGNSTFDVHIGGGGKGAVGGKFSSQKGSNIEPNFVNVTTRAEGGDGGTNSAGLGAGGLGGLGAMHEINGAGVPVDTPSTVAGNGTYVVGGSYPVVGGGRGGGGGAGRADGDGTPWSAPRNGADGADGSTFEAPGENAGSQLGGSGAGANIQPVSGVSEVFGGNIPGTNPGGVVVIKLS